jgi:hypothetical protein
MVVFFGRLQIQLQSMDAVFNLGCQQTINQPMAL